MRPSTLAFLLATSGAIGLFACSKSSSTSSSGGVTYGTPEEQFRGFQADLIKTCGGVAGACHVNGTYHSIQGDQAALWLGPGDPYTTAKAYPGIIPITGDPNDSKLLTQVEHDGPALISNQDLFDKVKTWVTAEVNAAGATLPSTAAATVKEGTNTVDLSSLSAKASGATLTFDATQTGDLLLVSNMDITAPKTVALVIDTAVLVIYPASGPVQTDQLDGFSGVLTVSAGTTASFFSGSTILQKWNPLNRLRFVFRSFTTTDSVDAGPVNGCVALDLFKSSATPALGTDIGDGRTCLTCHANQGDDFADGGLAAVAVATMDLTMITKDPATACAQALTQINKADRPNSNIVVTPTGGASGDPTHPVRALCGDGGATPCVPQSFVDGMTTWIAGEK